MSESGARCAFVFRGWNSDINTPWHYVCGGFEEQHPIGIMGDDRHAFVPPTEGT